MESVKGSKKPRVVVIGGGGIGEAIVVMLPEMSGFALDLDVVDRDQKTLDRVARIAAGTSHSGELRTLRSDILDPSPQLLEALAAAELVLDCSPGSLSIETARLALENEAHYANLTEYVAETKAITDLAAGAKTCFALQCGLAPGIINVLAMKLVQRLRSQFGVEIVDQVAMRVGALTRHAVSPDFYGFTWSPEGVATEYVEPATVIRDFRVRTLPSLTERRVLRVEGVVYEEALTSGGAADLPDALFGTVRNLDYKTLRHPGHYDWLAEQLAEIPEGEERSRRLQVRMEEAIPHVEDDEVVIYAAAEGSDGVRNRRLETAVRVGPVEIAGVRLRAIQATTAAGLAEVARMLLSNRFRGVLTQSKIPVDDFLTGPFVSGVVAFPDPRVIGSLKPAAAIDVESGPIIDQFSTRSV